MNSLYGVNKLSQQWRQQQERISTGRGFDVHIVQFIEQPKMAFVIHYDGHSTEKAKGGIECSYFPLFGVDPQSWLLYTNYLKH